jgi:alkylation response protein AidB-like acyl-CoA dehydrogenase
VVVGPARGGWRLVEARAPGVRLRPMSAIVGGLWTEIECASAASRPAGDLTTLVEVGAALQSAYAAGAAAALLESTVAYVSERRQFGRAIGSFQAVQHTLASAAIAADQARVLARRAVAEVDGAGDAARYWSSVAFVGATDRFVDVARRCHQVWGGMGFSTESHVHHFSRRARLLTQTWGGRDRHLDVVARERLRMPLPRDRYAEARS